MIELYIVLGCLCILVTLFVYIRLQWPFWSIQPVFHVYDMWRYWSRRPFQIQYGTALKTKFTDFDHVVTVPFADLTDERLGHMVDLLQCHYIPTDRILTLIDTSIIRTLLTGHSQPSYVSFYCEPHYEIVYDGSGGTLTELDPLSSAGAKVKPTIQEIGCMSARPIRLFLWDYGQQFAKHSVYFWDHICIHRNHVSKPWTKHLIQTHEYMQRLKNPNIPISLFRKEQALCEGIVPLVQFNIYTFSLRTIRPPPLPPHVTVTRLSSGDIGILSDFLYNCTSTPQSMRKGVYHCTSTDARRPLFTLCAFPELGSIDGLLKHPIWYVYAIRRKYQIYGMYFLKNAATNFEDVDQGNLLECMATISMVPGQDDNLFFAGFLHTLYNIMSLRGKDDPVYRMISFTDLSHTGRLLETWRWKYSPVFENPAAYYIYNMVVPKMPLSKETCMILL